MKSFEKVRKTAYRRLKLETFWFFLLFWVILMYFSGKELQLSLQKRVLLSVIPRKLHEKRHNSIHFGILDHFWGINLYYLEHGKFRGKNADKFVGISDYHPLH